MGRFGRSFPLYVTDAVAARATGLTPCLHYQWLGTFWAMLAIHTGPKYLTSFATVAKHRNTFATALKRQTIGVRDVARFCVVGQVNRLTHRRVDMPLKCRLDLDVPFGSDLVSRGEQLTQLLRGGSGIQPSGRAHVFQQRLGIRHFGTQPANKLRMNINALGRADHFPPIAQREEGLDTAGAVG